MGLGVCCGSVRMTSCAQFSFYDRQNSHFMTDEFHFMTEKFHFMTEPTTTDKPEAISRKRLLNERSFSIMRGC
jgi:hypothetical protein